MKHPFTTVPYKQILVMAIVLPLIACVANSDEAGKRNSLALVNGQIYTVNSNHSIHEAVVMEGDEITFVGSTKNAQAFMNDETEVINLQGKMVLPGIHDTHLHPLEAGLDEIKCTLESEQALNDWLVELKVCAANNIQQEWLLGWGHNINTLLASNTSPKNLLDTIEIERPMAIMEATSHSVWVNSKALQLAGITASTVHPQGGAILKDEQGRPNGVLLDAAGDLIFDLALAPTPSRMESNYQGLLYGLEQVAKNGITSIADARVYWRRNYLETWRRAQKENQLTARTTLGLWAYPDMNDVEQLDKLKSMYSNDPASLLRVNQVKLYSDGITHNTTAALLSPYEDYFEEVGDKGLNYFNEDRLALYASELQAAGFNMHIHAIGDRGVQESLDAIEYAQNQAGIKSSARHRITHVEIVNEEDVDRFAQLGVIADFQLAGDFTKPEYFHEMESLIGRRAFDMLPVNDIYQTGAMVTLSSDWDVSALSPFVGMQNALTRGEQSLPSLDAVIRAYTINGAYSLGQESVAGSIEVGKKADMIIIDQNLLEVPVQDIAKTQVLKTIFAGEIIYEK